MEVAGGRAVVRKSRFLEKILHSKSLRMINGASGITKSSQERPVGTELLRGSDLEKAVGTGQGGFLRASR